MEDRFDFKHFIIYGYAIKTYKVLDNLKVTFKFGSLYQLRKFIDKYSDKDLTPEILSKYVIQINDKPAEKEDLENLPEPVFRKVAYMFSKFLSELMTDIVLKIKDLNLDFAEVFLFMYPRFLKEIEDANYDLSLFSIEMNVLSYAAAQVKNAFFLSSILPLIKPEKLQKVVMDFQNALFPVEAGASEKQLLAKLKAWEEILHPKKK